jgi:endo-1,4-beta-xylanase
LINGFTLTQVSGPSCTPTITPPASYPIALGDIPQNGTASASFSISIVGCNPNSQFTVTVPWSSATYDTGTMETTLDFNRGKGH